MSLFPPRSDTPFHGGGRRVLIALFSFVLLFQRVSLAQVPSEYASLDATMQTDLTNFAVTVDAGWDGSKPPVQFSGELYPATSVSVPASNFLQTTIIPYINALQALGVKTVKFAINFPVLYEPYYDSPVGANNPAGYQQTLGFYQSVVAQLRQRGMKVIIPTQVVFPYEYSTTTPYFQSLTLAQYSAARSAMAQTIASELKPDYLIVQSEPVTEVGNLPSNLATALGDTATDLNMVSGILSDLQNAGLRSASLQVGAGMGTWQPDFDTFLSGFVSLPMDLLDVHVYPINDRVVSGQNVDFLGRILQMADAAHASGMKVGMAECWPYKESDNELAVDTSDQTIPSRDVYSFWTPLDGLFLQTMAEVGYWKQFEFINPFWSLYFFAYLDYAQMQPLIAGQTPDQAAAILEQQENKAAFAAIEQGQTTSTGVLYSQIVAGTVPVAHTPVITSNPIGSVQANISFSYQITSTDAPTTFNVSGLPTGLAVDTSSGLISGAPTESGSFAVALSATNANGTGTATLTLTVTAGTSPSPTPTPTPTPTGSPTSTPALPTVTILTAGNPDVDGGEKGNVLFTRTGDMSATLTVRYKIQGSAKAGLDYKPLPGTVTIPAGAASVKVKVKTIDDPAADGLLIAKVKLLPALDGSYALGNSVMAKIKIADDQ